MRSLPWLPLFGCLLMAPMLRAASPPPAADLVARTTVQLATPKKESDRRSKPPYDQMQIHLWLPGESPVVRGLVFNPFHEGAVEQRHWQEAARLWGFGILAADYFGVRSEEFAATLTRGLEQLAEELGRPELRHVPLCPLGMSAGAGMSVRFAELLPERTLAAGPVCLEVGPRDEASRAIPMITVFGERDGRQMEILAAKLPEQRVAGARWATAVQWGRRHEFARANNLVMVLFDRALRL